MEKRKKGRPVEVDETEKATIKELFETYGKFRTVARIVNRDPLTIKKILGIQPQKEKVIEGYFNWSDYNKSII